MFSNELITNTLFVYAWIVTYFVQGRLVFRDHQVLLEDVDGRVSKACRVIGDILVLLVRKENAGMMEFLAEMAYREPKVRNFSPVAACNVYIVVAKFVFSLSQVKKATEEI